MRQENWKKLSAKSPAIKRQKSSTSSPKRYNLVIKPDGTISAIYSDDLVRLFEEGEFTVNRASYVEPNGKGQWIVDLKPVNGPVLGPFRLRETALDVEVDWLNANLFD